MAENSGQEKTEPATQRRLEDAKQKGQVARSVEVNSVILFILALLFFGFYGSHFMVNFKKIFLEFFQMIRNPDINVNNIQELFISILQDSFQMLFPFFIIMLVGGVLTNIFQIGFIFTTQTMEFDLNKINPFSGFKKIFSRKTFIELLKSIFKVALVALIAYWGIRSRFEEIILAIDKDIPQISLFISSLAFSVVIKITIAMILIAILDFMFQRWDHLEKLKMTKQEVKEEMKQYEGDPILKSRIRSIQREMSRKRMLQKVPEAEVVITNPTHFAIAISYNVEEDPAPKVLAKGADYIAQKIREVAKEHYIPIVENKPLAQALYKACEPGDFIPEDLFSAVAEVLSYVYKLKGKKVV